MQKVAQILISRLTLLQKKEGASEPPAPGETVNKTKTLEIPSTEFEIPAPSVNVSIKEDAAKRPKNGYKAGDKILWPITIVNDGNVDLEKLQAISPGLGAPPTSEVEIH